jgi:hypothetical protein
MSQTQLTIGLQCLQAHTERTVFWWLDWHWSEYRDWGTEPALLTVLSPAPAGSPHTYIQSRVYSGTPLFRTPLGLFKVSWLKEVSSFQGYRNFF